MSEANAGLAVRLAGPADLRWVEAWAAELGLPAPCTGGVRAFIFLRGGRRVGYGSTRHDLLRTPDGPEPVVWIVAGFLVPAFRGQGLALAFAEIVSREYYPRGKFGARVATSNSRMLRLMELCGFPRHHSSPAWVDFVFQLDAPFRAPG